MTGFTREMVVLILFDDDSNLPPYIFPSSCPMKAMSGVLESSHQALSIDGIVMAKCGSFAKRLGQKQV